MPGEIKVEIEIARHFWRRAIGLLGRRSLGAHQGLLITPCDSVHTFFMRWPIDVVFIDRAGTITRIVERLQPWRCAAASLVSPPSGGHWVGHQQGSRPSWFVFHRSLR